MDEESQQFLDAEKKAAELAETLQKLYSEVASYQAAKADLEATRDNLLDLINQSKSIMESSKESVEIVRSIGGPEIMDTIEKANAFNIERFRKVNEELHGMNEELNGIHESMVERLSENAKSNNEKITQLTAWLDSVQKYVVETITTTSNKSSETLENKFKGLTAKLEEMKMLVIVSIIVSGLSMVFSLLM